MASVKIDLGFGEQAILSERAGLGFSTAKHQRDAEQFLRRWPRTRSIEQESGYLRQLGLHLGNKPPGVNSSDTSEQLRAAVKSGKIMVVIERAPASTGGGVSASQPTRRPFPLETWEELAARKKAKLEQAKATSRLSALDSRPTSSSMTTGDLVALLTYVKTGNVGQLLDDFGQVADDSSAPTPLGDAAAFEYGEDTSFAGQTEQDAGFFLTPDIEAECEHGLNLDLDECSAWEAAKPGTWSMCHSRSMERYSNCLRGRALD